MRFGFMIRAARNTIKDNKFLYVHSTHSCFFAFSSFAPLSWCALYVTHLGWKKRERARICAMDTFFFFVHVAEPWQDGLKLLSLSHFHVFYCMYPSVSCFAHAITKICLFCDWIYRSKIIIYKAKYIIRPKERHSVFVYARQFKLSSYFLFWRNALSFIIIESTH